MVVATVFESWNLQKEVIRMEEVLRLTVPFTLLSEYTVSSISQCSRFNISMGTNIEILRLEAEQLLLRETIVSRDKLRL